MGIKYWRMVAQRGDIKRRMNKKEKEREGSSFMLFNSSKVGGEGITQSYPKWNKEKQAQQIPFAHLPIAHSP